MEDKRGTLALITDHAFQKPLILTPTQLKWAASFSTDWPALWLTINSLTKKMRSSIATLTNTLISKMPRHQDLYSPPPLAALLTLYQVSKKVIFALWSQWKLITWTKHNSPDLAKLNRHKLAHKFLNEEIQRAKNTEWM